MSNAAGFYVTITTVKGATVKRVVGDTLLIGRAEDCNLRIPHEELGRRHITISLKSGKTFVEDHGSTNGTYINGQRLMPHEPLVVVNKDQIQLGHSGISLTVSLEAQTLQHEESVGEVTSKKAIVTTTNRERQAQRLEAKAPEQKLPVLSSPEQSEALFFETQKKIAAMLQEAEREAERKVQSAFQHAEERKTKSEQTYQRKLIEAFRESEAIYKKAQTEVNDMLEQARKHAQEVRAEAEQYALERRKQTDDECEQNLEDAQKMARELKENRLLEADDLIRQREQELLKETKVAIQERIRQFDVDMEKEAIVQRQKIEEALTTQIQSLSELKLEMVRLEDSKNKELQNLTATRAEGDQQRSLINQLKSEAADLTEKASRAQAQFNSATTKATDAEKRSAHLQGQLTELQSRLAGIHGDESAYLKRVEDAKATSAQELLALKEKFEASKLQIEKAEQKHAEQLKLDNLRRGQELEKHLLEELEEKKLRLGRELALTVETFLKEHQITTSHINFSDLQNKVTDQFTVQIVSLSKDPEAKTKQASLISLKRADQMKIRFTGAVLGAALLFGGQRLYTMLKSDAAPLQRQVAAAAEERRHDLEARKFNPPQVQELKETYTDAVLYTDAFVSTYQNPDFQRKFLRELAPYMLRTWRLEEDKTIQVMAASASLVKELAERKENIHPDFVQKDLEKMRELEAQSVTHMQEILGSQVRYESFKKFEKKFFEDSRSTAHTVSN